MRVVNLLASDDPAVQSLSERLTDKALFHSAGLYQIENRRQRASKFEALRRRYVALGQVGIVKHEDSGNAGAAPEIRRNGHVELRRTQVREFIKAEGRLVAVYTLDLPVPVPGPQCPKDQVRPISHRKQNEPVNTAVLPCPVPGFHMIGMCAFGESGRPGLLGGKETLLLFSELEEPPLRFTVRLSHNTILQLYWYSIKRMAQLPVSSLENGGF